MNNVITHFRCLPVILLSLLATFSSQSATKHVINFGGALGIIYSPDSIMVAPGDTIQWQGDFSMHPLSSTTIPVGAPGWHAGADTVFKYVPGLPGSYHYHCDIHFSFGMVGVFIVVNPAPSIVRGWNILSVPFQVSDFNSNVLYPHAISHAYIYQNGYVPQNTLAVGEGFWLKFGQDQNDSISGAPVSLDTVDVTVGWNMVGSISTTIAALNIVSLPPNIVTSRFFGYSLGYQISDSIRSGKGYWVKVSQSGQLVLSDQSFGNSAARIRIVPTGELPPSPPAAREEAPLPRAYILEQNYPNPFNPATVIKYQLPATSRVTLGVYNLQGQLVSRLVDRVQAAGNKFVDWNAADFASGIYLYRLDATSVADPRNNISQVRKMLLVR